jgi:hypothetical protein
MAHKSSAGLVLRKLDGIERELAKLRRDIIHSLVGKKDPNRTKPSLFGSVRGGDVTEKMIMESQRSLFRDLKDLGAGRE